MTIPNNEELQCLLDQATPGEHYATDENDGSDLIIEETGQSLLVVTSEGIAMFDRVADGKLAALAPYLAAEVIRLRKAIKELRNHYIELMEISDKANIVDSLMMGHALSVVDELNTVLEGDQA